MARGKHYHVYVVELSQEVLRQPRFIKSNPGYVAGKPCVYVGMTGLDPEKWLGLFEQLSPNDKWSTGGS